MEHFIGIIKNMEDIRWVANLAVKLFKFHFLKGKNKLTS